MRTTLVFEWSPRVLLLCKLNTTTQMVVRYTSSCIHTAVYLLAGFIRLSFVSEENTCKYKRCDQNAGVHGTHYNVGRHDHPQSGIEFNV